jgi:hypothetical protein
MNRLDTERGTQEDPSILNPIDNLLKADLDVLMLPVQGQVQNSTDR